MIERIAIPKATLILSIVLAFAAVAPLSATNNPPPGQGPDPVILSNSQEPGSFLVWPLFEYGTTSTPSDDPYGITTPTVPNTEFSISVSCPTGTSCKANQPVTIHLEWVCGGVSVYPFIPCYQNDFVLYTTVNGTVRFNPGAPGISPTCEPVASYPTPGCGLVVPPPTGCYSGFLVAWVVNNSTLALTKFNGLIGDAEIRDSSTAVTAYDAIPIQAVAASPSGLNFNGIDYSEATGEVQASVRYDYLNPTTGWDQDETYLILLTLDTLSNKLNYPTYVNVNFYNEIEQVDSESANFGCWGDFSLYEYFGLSSSYFGPKGLLQSGQATKSPVAGISDKSGPVTLLGLIVTYEYPSTGDDSGPLREFAVPLYNNSKAVPTSFVP
jgi:hypothetical protein